MPSQPDDDKKLNQGLLGILRKKFPNASPGALEKLKSETETNPLAAAVIPSDWTQLAVDKASTEKYDAMFQNALSANSLGQLANSLGIGSNANQAISQGNYSGYITYGNDGKPMMWSTPPQTVQTRMFPTTYAYAPAGVGYPPVFEPPAPAKPVVKEAKKPETIQRGQRSILLDQDF